MGARQNRSTAIYAVTWTNRSMTVVTASRPQYVRRNITGPDREAREDEWRATGHLRIPDPVPVTRLEIGVGPRRNLNAPTFCLVRMAGREIFWAVSGRERARERWTSDEARSPDGTTGLWSYVCQAWEAVFFNAPDHDAACDHVLRRARAWGFTPPANRRLVSVDLEPLDRMGISLRPPSLRSAPRRYWAWVDGVKVGWPSATPEASAASAPVPSSSSATPAVAYALPPLPLYLE